MKLPATHIQTPHDCGSMKIILLSKSGKVFLGPCFLFRLEIALGYLIILFHPMDFCQLLIWLPWIK